MSELSDKLTRILVASGMESARQEALEELRALEAKLEALEGAIALIAEDALWHDGSDNPEALEDIRKTVKALGYTRAKILAAANE